MKQLIEIIRVSSKYKWLVYASVAVATYTTVADQTGTNIAMPRISEELALDIPTVQWIYLLYTLCISACVIPMGKLSDVLGRKKVYCSGAVLFLIGSVVVCFSGYFSILLFGKAVQGVGAAMIQANGMALIVEAFPRSERGKALGLYLTIIGTGAVGGPVIGGFLVDLFGWRVIYVVSAALSFAGLLLSLTVLKQFSANRKDALLNFDWPGAALSAGFLSTVLISLTFSYRVGWADLYVLLGFLFSFVLLGGFLYREKVCENPMVELSLFRHIVFSLVMAARFMSFMAVASSFFLMPFYLIQIMEMEESLAALIMAPASLMMAIGGPLSGKISDSFGTKWPAVLGLLFTCGALMTFSTLSVQSSTLIVIIGMFFSGSGSGIFGSPSTSTVMGIAGQSRYGVVTALVNMARTTGNMTGLSMGITLVVFSMGVAGYDADLSTISELGHGTEAIQLKSVFTLGMQRAFIVGAFIAGIAALLIALSPIENRKDL